MGTRENKNAKIANLRNPRNPRKFKPAKIRARTVYALALRRFVPSGFANTGVPLT